MPVSAALAFPRAYLKPGRRIPWAVFRLDFESFEIIQRELFSRALVKFCRLLAWREARHGVSPQHLSTTQMSRDPKAGRYRGEKGEHRQTSRNGERLEVSV